MCGIGETLKRTGVKGERRVAKGTFERTSARRLLTCGVTRGAISRTDPIFRTVFVRMTPNRSARVTVVIGKLGRNPASVTFGPRTDGTDLLIVVRTHCDIAVLKYTSCPLLLKTTPGTPMYMNTFFTKTLVGTSLREFHTRITRREPKRNLHHHSGLSIEPTVRFNFYRARPFLLIGVSVQTLGTLYHYFCSRSRLRSVYNIRSKIRQSHGL